MRFGRRLYRVTFGPFIHRNGLRTAGIQVTEPISTRAWLHELRVAESSCYASPKTQIRLVSKHVCLPWLYFLLWTTATLH